MKKIQTLFKKDPNDLGRVTDELNVSQEFLNNARVYVKRDGTSCMVKDGILYKRYDAKINKKTGEYKRPIPEGAIPCQGADKLSGHHPHWVKCDRDNPADKWHFEALDNAGGVLSDGTYELVGPKVNGNNERLDSHSLINHLGEENYIGTSEDIHGDIFNVLSEHNIEGLIFRVGDEMYKIRRKDFGLDWPIKEKSK